MIGLALLLGAALAGTAGSAGMAGEPESFGVSAVAGMPETVTLEQVLQLLRKKSPRSAAERALVEVARAGVVAAGVLPNPSFDYGWNHLFSGTNTGSATVNQLAADQPLLLFGQRRQRRRSAELGVRLAESRFAESYAERAREARERFTSLLARQEKQLLLEESSEDLRRVARVVEKRAEAGDRSRYDALRIEVEAREVQTALADARADVEDASGRLAALLGFPEWRPRAVGELRPAAPGDPNYIDTADIEGLWSRAQQLRPALVVAKRSEAAARGAGKAGDGEASGDAKDGRGRLQGRARGDPRAARRPPVADQRPADPSRRSGGRETGRDRLAVPRGDDRHGLTGLRRK